MCNQFNARLYVRTRTVRMLFLAFSIVFLYLECITSPDYLLLVLFALNTEQGT